MASASPSRRSARWGSGCGRRRTWWRRGCSTPTGKLLGRGVGHDAAPTARRVPPGPARPSRRWVRCERARRWWGWCRPRAARRRRSSGASCAPHAASPRRRRRPWHPRARTRNRRTRSRRSPRAARSPPRVREGDGHATHVLCSGGASDSRPARPALAPAQTQPTPVPALARPAGVSGTVVVPDRFLRRWDPVTVFFDQRPGPATGRARGPPRALRRPRAAPPRRLDLARRAHPAVPAGRPLAAARALHRGRVGGPGASPSRR